MGQHVGEAFIIKGGVIAVAVCHSEATDEVLRFGFLDDVAVDGLYIFAAEDIAQQHHTHPFVVVVEQQAHAEAILQRVNHFRDVNVWKALTRRHRFMEKLIILYRTVTAIPLFVAVTIVVGTYDFAHTCHRFYFYCNALDVA